MAGALAATLTSAQAGAPASAGRPEPLRRHVQITLVEEVIGQFWRINDVTYFVHDLRLARTPDGAMAYLGFDLETDDGERYRRADSLADLPPGSSEAFSLDDAFGLGGRTLWWADGSGEVHGMNLAPGEQLVGPGGAVVLPTPPRCTLVSGGYCLPDTCPRGCDPFPSCRCIQENGSTNNDDFCLAMGVQTCTGRCGVGSCASEPILKGCTCQP